MRLDDEELAVICSALRARVAGTGKASQAYIIRLCIRLEEMAPGNPEWTLSGVVGFEKGVTPRARVS